MSLKSLVEELYQEYKERTEGGGTSTTGKGIGGGGDPHEPLVSLNTTSTLNNEPCISNMPLLKGKHKGKFRNTATVKRNDEMPICSHYEKKGHVVDRCWK
jgi:hypothetical protein